MDVLSLCSGIGGLDFFTKSLGWRTVGYVEKASYRREVLFRRMEDGQLDSAPIFDDLRTFNGKEWRGLVDCIVGGFPCQPFSKAGKQRGADDPRNLWPDVYRVLCEVRPRFAFLENVPGLIHGAYWGTILGDLAEGGFDVRWDCVPAAAAGANHLRDRLWILVTDPTGEGHAEQARQHDTVGRGEQPNGDGQDGPVAHADGAGLRKPPERSRWWEVEPSVGRVADGVPHWMDRLGSLGDAVVNQQALLAWKLLS